MQRSGDIARHAAIWFSRARCMSPNDAAMQTYVTHVFATTIVCNPHHLSFRSFASQAKSVTAAFEGSLTMWQIFMVAWTALTSELALCHQTTLIRIMAVCLHHIVIDDLRKYILWSLIFYLYLFQRRWMTLTSSKQIICVTHRKWEWSHCEKYYVQKYLFSQRSIIVSVLQSFVTSITYPLFLTNTSKYFLLCLTY